MRIKQGVEQNLLTTGVNRFCSSISCFSWNLIFTSSLYPLDIMSFWVLNVVSYSTDKMGKKDLESDIICSIVLSVR